MKTIINKLFLATGIVFSTILFLGSCSKNNDDTSMGSSSNKDYFVNNVLARDLTVTLAKDDNTDITADFVAYTFHLNDSTGTYGSITAANIQKTVIGTWTSDAAYEKVTFNFAGTPVPALAFLNKPWSITSRGSVSTGFAAANGESDVFQFTKK
jgi:hypothetical protein